MITTQVGMGKTAVALAATQQPRPRANRHAGRLVDPNQWSDELLYDGLDGFPGHLHRCACDGGCVPGLCCW